MREVYIEALAEGHALTDEQLSESLTETLNAKPKGAGLVGVRVRITAVESTVSVRRSRDARRCTDCIGASACCRSRRAARHTRRASCSDSIAAARAAAWCIGCRRRWRWTSCTCCGAARWSPARTRRAGCTSTATARPHDRAGIRRAARPSAIRGQADDRRAGGGDCARRGAFGSSADYLERTRVSLATHGIVDLYLERLASRVAARGW